MAVIFHLEINLGAGLIETFVIRDKNGNPVDLSGYEASVTFYTDYGESELLKVATTDAGDDLSITGALGQVHIKIPEGDLDEFPRENPVKWHLDIWDASDGVTYKSREIRGNCPVIGTSSNELA